MRHANQLPLGLLALSVLVLGPSAPPAESQARRIRGVIDKDETWSGRILLTDDVTIQNCVVTVEPGAVIEFAQMDPGLFPVLTVGSPDRAGGQLKVLATADRPITLRTLPGANPGRVVVHVHAETITPRPTASAPRATAPPMRRAGGATWRHVHVQRLGQVRSKRAATKDVKVADAAIEVHVIGPTESVLIADCVFENSARLSLTAADGAAATVSSNRITQPLETMALEVCGGQGSLPVGAVEVTRNRVEAAIAVRSAPAVVADNVVIGPHASLVVEDDRSERTRISGNYVHNTADQDDGRYCLNNENPQALIEGNVFRGGTTCVLSGSRRMRRNVILGSANLASPVVKHGRTHQLVRALPPGSVFERNLLLGPAYSLLMPQPEVGPPAEGTAAADDCVIRNNLFDGVGESSRAIHLNPLGRAPITLTVVNNLFLRVPALVFDEGRTERTLAYFDYNAAAPTPDRPFDQVRIAGRKPGDLGWASRDVVRPRVADFGLSASPPIRLDEVDAKIQSGEITLDRLRDQFFAAYRPGANSPLRRAGRPEAGATSPPSIGPDEP